jgi:hypothetical protein
MNSSDYSTIPDYLAGAESAPTEISISVFESKPRHQSAGVQLITIAASDVTFEPMAPLTPRQAQLEKRFISFESLRANRGEDDPEPPTAESMEAIRQLANCLPAGIETPRATISEDGEPAIYWDTAATYLEISAERVGGFYLFVRNKAAGTRGSIPNWKANKAGLAKLKAALKEGAI